MLQVYNAAKLDKTYQYSGLISYNRKFGQARIILTDFEMQDILTSQFILLTVFLL